MSNMRDTGVAKRLREARERAGLTAVVLAQKIERHPSQVSRWENGVDAPRADVILAIARACGVSTDWLLSGEGVGPAAEVA